MVSLEQLRQRQQQELAPLSNNYYDRVNAAYRQEIEKGDTGTPIDFDNIRSKNKSNWWDAIVDAIAKPSAAVTWVKTMLFDSIGDTWFGKLFNINKSLESSKQEILKESNIPYLQSQRQLNSILKDFPPHKLTHESPLNVIKKAIELSSRSIKEKDFILDLVTLNQFLKNNPRISSNSSLEERNSKEFWEDIFKKAELSSQHDEMLFKLIVLGESYQKIFQQDTISNSQGDSNEDNSNSNNSNNEEQKEEIVINPKPSETTESSRLEQIPSIIPEDALSSMAGSSVGSSHLHLVLSKLEYQVSRKGEVTEQVTSTLNKNIQSHKYLQICGLDKQDLENQDSTILETLSQLQSFDYLMSERVTLTDYETTRKAGELYLRQFSEQQFPKYKEKLQNFIKANKSDLLELIKVSAFTDENGDQYIQLLEGNFFLTLTKDNNIELSSIKAEAYTQNLITTAEDARRAKKYCPQLLESLKKIDELTISLLQENSQQTQIKLIDLLLKTNDQSSKLIIELQNYNTVDAPFYEGMASRFWRTVNFLKHRTPFAFLVDSTYEQDTKALENEEKAKKDMRQAMNNSLGKSLSNIRTQNLHLQNLKKEIQKGKKLTPNEVLEFYTNSRIQINFIIQQTLLSKDIKESLLNAIPIFGAIPDVFSMYEKLEQGEFKQAGKHAAFAVSSALPVVKFKSLMKLSLLGDAAIIGVSIKDAKEEAKRAIYDNQQF